MSHLYNALGNTFGVNNNLPVPIEYSTPAEIEAAALRAAGSAHMHLKGEHVTLRFGYTCMTSQQVEENISEGLQHATSKLPAGAWKRVASVHLKTPSSPSLPLYGLSLLSPCELMLNCFFVIVGKQAGEALAFVKEKAQQLQAEEVKKRKAAEVVDEEKVKPVKKSAKKSKASEPADEVPTKKAVKKRKAA